MRNWELVSSAVLLLCCGGRERFTEAVDGVPTSSADGGSMGLAGATATGAGAPATAPSATLKTAMARSVAISVCAERFPMITPVDIGWPPTAGGMPGQPGALPPMRPLEPVLAECLAQAGTQCDIDSLLSPKAAICAAQLTGTDAVGWGGVPWLGFNADSRRLEWSVTAGICCGDVWEFRVDASSGASELVSHRDAPPFNLCTAACTAPEAPRTAPDADPKP